MADAPKNGFEELPIPQYLSQLQNLRVTRQSSDSESVTRTTAFAACIIQSEFVRKELRNLGFDIQGFLHTTNLETLEPISPNSSSNRNLSDSVMSAVAHYDKIALEEPLSYEKLFRVLMLELYETHIRRDKVIGVFQNRAEQHGLNFVQLERWWNKFSGENLVQNSNDQAVPESTESNNITTADNTEFHNDRAVEKLEDDTLNRAMIAEVLVEKAKEIWPKQVEHNRPFVVHLSGRWGSGKSTILSFMKQLLLNDDSLLSVTKAHLASNEKRGWIVLEINAWQRQKKGTAWWALLNTLVEQSQTQVGSRRLKLWLSDKIWRLTTGNRATFVTLLCIVAGIVLLFYGADFLTSGNGDANSPTESKLSLLDIIKTGGTLVGVFGGSYALITTINSRLKNESEAIQNIDSDPTKRLKERYTKIFEDLHRPVAFLIDDLDRCDADYIVELLQAIQTVYANTPILYVVAADKRWIASAYEQHYEDFISHISTDEQDLGHLFLDKIFQLSVSVPELSVPEQKKFLSALTSKRTLTETPKIDSTALEQEFESVKTESELVNLVSKYKHSELGAEAARLGLKTSVRADIQAEVEHRLIKMSGFMASNPRSIKKIVNAYSFKLGFALLTQLDIDNNKLTMWCILEHQFPKDHDKLIENPSLLKSYLQPDNAENQSFNAEIANILKGFEEEDIAKLKFLC